MPGEEEEEWYCFYSPFSGSHVQRKKGGADSDAWLPHAHRERRVRMADRRVPHGKLNSFITMGKMVFSPST
jgi:hypothetical protein